MLNWKYRRISICRMVLISESPLLVVSRIRTDENLEFYTNHFNTYVIGEMLSITNNSPSHSSSGNSSHEQSNFWSNVATQIKNANTGDTVTITAESPDNMSASVMQGMRACKILCKVQSQEF